MGLCLRAHRDGIDCMVTSTVGEGRLSGRTACDRAGVSHKLEFGESGVLRVNTSAPLRVHAPLAPWTSASWMSPRLSRHASEIRTACWDCGRLPGTAGCTRPGRVGVLKTTARVSAKQGEPLAMPGTCRPLHRACDESPSHPRRAAATTSHRFRIRITPTPVSERRSLEKETHPLSQPGPQPPAPAERGEGRRGGMRVSGHSAEGEI